MNKALVVLLVLLPLLGLSTNFVVTNNSTSGNGSLSQAIMDASQNGTATSDTISFNLPVTETTIQLTSELVLSSNLVIDGITQPGKGYGKTDTKIRLQPIGCTIGFKVESIKNIEVYGLWFSNFTTGSLSCFGSAISIRNTDHFTLGKPAKGNCK